MFCPIIYFSMESIDALTEKLGSYLKAKEIELVKKAYNFASQAHTGQYRSSGDPYVSHPIAVANILSSFQMDQDSIQLQCFMMSWKTLALQKML